jgi:6-phosphogluconolactonase/glucosamine-6-phosphate isomerase/deaminase
MNLSMILESKKIILLISNEKKLKLIESAPNDVNLPIYYLLNQKEQKVEIFKTY